MIKIEKNETSNETKIITEFILETDYNLINRVDLGKTKQICKLCGFNGDFQTWTGIEMFVGLRDKFNYFICPDCEVLQIEKIPEDIGKYYAHDYYSFNQPAIEPVKPGSVRDSRMILDVGCGAGTWLCFLATIGCVNLFGCDPFIENDIKYINGVKIKKCSIHEMQGEYDVIHLSHSFEHMADPIEVFQTFDRLLKRGKGVYGDTPKIEIDIPIFPNLAFNIYGPFWYQMDPPRHFFLHSIKSIYQLAERNGFTVTDVQFQSGGGQFYVSRMYQMGATFIEHAYRLENDSAFAELKAQRPVFDALSAYANVTRRADQASFTLIRK